MLSFEYFYRDIAVCLDTPSTLARKFISSLWLLYQIDAPLVSLQILGESLQGVTLLQLRGEGAVVEENLVLRLVLCRQMLIQISMKYGTFYDPRYREDLDAPILIGFVQGRGWQPHAVRC